MTWAVNLQQSLDATPAILVLEETKGILNQIVRVLIKIHPYVNA
jgi:hypothetical protein